MSYREILGYLYNLRHHGIKLGLENPAKLITITGNPQRSYRTVHVAGTNGKGSTVSMIASVLQAAGIRTGTFTSPHLVSFTERIQVDGERIGEDDVIRLARLIRSRVEEAGDLNPTFFEFVTAMAFMYFMEEEVEWAVIETGMGGRFDATNVISPDVTVITPVGLDHREFLGETLAEIAYEKAGIIKDGVPLVLAPQDADALKTILGVAGERNAPVYMYGDDFRAGIQEVTASGVRFDYMTGHGDLPRPGAGMRDLPLTGAYQAVNAAVAVRASELVLESCGFPAESLPRIIRSGLSRTSWPGRCELTVFRGMPVLLDGAHNPEAARALSETLQGVFLSASGRSEGYDGLILVFGAMADKDIEEILGPLLPLARAVVFTAPSYGRSESPGRLCRLSAEILDARTARDGAGPESIHTAPSVEEALELASRLCRRGDLVVVTGSFYTVGEAREAMGEGAVLSRLREHG
ncbi:MAG: bifunctional folylpolyglutamate synthase/dihydrofolate synthase [Nitrospirae bacterium]|nr:bifunctional folylpolyglutamate synthase/dihydrofolate synthase [Nitrospirota bacterium]